MECSQGKDLKCNNLNMDKCKTCKAPMLCMCQRPEVKKMVEYLWLESNNCRKNKKPLNQTIKRGPKYNQSLDLTDKSNGKSARRIKMLCPRCNSEFVRLDSNREMEISEINCSDCGFGFQAPVPEECIEKMWAVITKEDTPDDGYDDSTLFTKKDSRMEILTPLKSILIKSEERLSKEDFFILQKEFLQAYAEGFSEGNKRSTPAEIKNAVLASSVWKDLDNSELRSMFN